MENQVHSKEIPRFHRRLERKSLLSETGLSVEFKDFPKGFSKTRIKNFLAGVFSFGNFSLDKQRKVTD